MNNDVDPGQRYRAFAELLAASGAEATPAEAHGVVCGALCAGVPCSAMEQWLPYLGLDSEEPGELAGRAREALGALCELAESRLRGEEFAFEPLLPADSESIDARAEAIARWCRGFVLALLDLGGHDVDRLPGDAAEIVRDMMAIGELESDDGEGDAAERAFEELHEYLRVGVQLVYEELNGARDAGGHPAGG